MKREVRITNDGSATLFVDHLDEHYHSIHGALQESKHVFIEAGLKAIPQQQIAILEIGLGTGLNAWLTAMEAHWSNLQIEYTGIEKYPVEPDEMAALAYERLAETKEEQLLLQQIHAAEWESSQPISPNFDLTKLKQPIESVNFDQAFHLIYFDAFAPSAQPELWSETIFQNMFAALKPGGILVTYCAKGQVKRNMKAVGFTIERLPGPPGKREMTRATKPASTQVQ